MLDVECAHKTLITDLDKAVQMTYPLGSCFALVTAEYQLQLLEKAHMQLFQGVEPLEIGDGF